MKRIYYATDYSGQLQNDQVGIAYSYEDCLRIEAELNSDPTIESYTYKDVE